MILKILKKKNPTLKKKCNEIKQITPVIKKLAQDMADTVKSNGGCGLAANQVGKLLRIITVKTDTFSEIMINPKITSQEGTQVIPESCLSLPGKTIQKTRSETIAVEFTCLDGTLRVESLIGFNAAVVQHEIDHLNGILIID